MKPNRGVLVSACVLAVLAIMLLLLEGLPLLSPGTATLGTGKGSEFSNSVTSLHNLGNRIWITELVFGNGIAWSSDWQDFGSGPRIKSVDQVNSTTTLIVAQSGGIRAYYTLSTGVYVIQLSQNFTGNNFSPGLQANDVVVMRQTVPTHSMSFPAVAYGQVEIDSAFGNATLTRNGETFRGMGTWNYYTGTRLADPSPGAFSALGGWVSTPRFILSFDEYYSSGYESSVVYWRDTGQVEGVQVAATDTSGDCSGYTLSVSTSRGPLTVTSPNLNIVLGTPCAGTGGTVNESFGTATSNMGDGWAFFNVFK